jgi:hypothetical protein
MTQQSDDPAVSSGQSAADPGTLLPPEPVLPADDPEAPGDSEPCKPLPDCPPLPPGLLVPDCEPPAPDELPLLWDHPGCSVNPIAPDSARAVMMFLFFIKSPCDVSQDF